MAFGVLDNIKRSNIQYTKFHGNNKFFSSLNLTFVHCLLLVVLVRQDINLDIFHDENMLNKNEQCRQATINLKTQEILVHITIHAIFKCMIQVKD
jgi:hypothetical protein